MITLGPIGHVASGGAIMGARDDTSLLSAIAQQRDREAFSELYERYQGRAFGIALRILRDPALAEDAVQDAMFSIWRLAIPAHIDDAQRWIFSVVTAKSFDLDRNRRRRARREECTVMEGNPEIGMSAELEGKESVSALRRQLDELPELESRLLVCSYGANMSHQKIGDMLGIPRQTVTDKIQQALGRLRANLAKAGVAAVVPLVSAENLFEAMTTGQECPPGMAARMLNRIDSAGSKAAKALSRRHRRVAVRSGGIGWIVGAVAVVAAGAALVWSASGKPAPRPSVPVSRANVPLAPAIPPPARSFPAVVTINFGPEGLDLPSGVLNDSGEPYDAVRGYGWIGPKKGKPIPGVIANLPDGPHQVFEGRDAVVSHLSNDVLRDTLIATGWRRHSETWMIDLPNGKYLFTVCCGDARAEQGPHEVVVQGKEIVKEVMTKTNEFFEPKDVPVEVTDGRLTMTVGGHDSEKTDGANSSDTTLNYLIIKRVEK